MQVPSHALIAALSWPGRVIGVKGRLPWHIPLELRLFRQITWGGLLVMGRRTYESLGKPYLPGRILWVISESLQTSSNPAVRVFPTWEQILRALQEVERPVFFAGGETVFRQALELPTLERLYLSWVIAEVAGDSFFPPLSEGWQPCRWEVFSRGPGVPLPFIFTEYCRQKK